MIHSFLNVFLPEDEYKRTRILYFVAETAFLAAAILLLLGSLNYFLHVNIDTEFILLLAPPLMVFYAYIRYIFSGIEYTEVADEQEYGNKRRMVFKRSLAVGAMFTVIFILSNGMPDNWEAGIDLIAMPLLFTILYFLFDYISLKRSYRKNKNILDE